MTENKTNSTATNPIGLIGCGRMGIGLCRNLIRGGYQVMACDIDPANLEAARKLGATPARDLAELLRTCATIMTCLPSLKAVTAVYEETLIEQCEAGTLIVEMSSSEPGLRAQQAEQAARRGIALVDAPMLRSAADAWEGTIQILLGGAPQDVEQARPFLSAVCEKIIDAGPLGNAHVMKALNNAVAMTNHAILSEIFSVAKTIGVNLESLYEMMQGSMAASYKLDDLIPKLLAGNHPRNAKLAFVEKDLSICAEVAHGTPILTPVLDSAYLTYRLACRMGGADEPPSRLADVLHNAG